MTTLDTDASHVSADSDVRLLLLAPDTRHTTTLDGAWWPQSTDLALELPALVAELHRRGRRVSRAAYHPSLWGPAPRVLQADGRTIHIGWFRSIDPHLISLTGGSGERLELLVVPPDTAEAVAGRAMEIAATARNRATPSAVLAVAASPVPAQR
jgi:hypothetical protein